MHQLHRSRGGLAAGLLAAAAVAFGPSVAEAGPKPGAPSRGFRLFASATAQIEVNRVSCGINTAGEICVNVSGSSTVPGNVWPRGTPNSYVFNSGLQLAAVVGEDGGPWAGDTTGAFFFDPKGTTQHGEQVTPIYDARNPEDLAAWPEEAYVPDYADQAKNLFAPSLRGQPTASQGDIWFMSWDGNPANNAQRKHPLGVVAEVRGLAWTYPTGNDDILYFLFTFYNVTSTDPADYAAVPEATRAILLDKAEEFQQLNEQAFGIQLPDGGYTLTDLYAAFAMDADVASYNDNYSSVNLPFALGFSYDATFVSPSDWLFPASIFSPPFFPAPGFVGVKYLSGPTGSGDIQLWGTTLNGGAFDDAQNATQLFRYLSGNLGTGDQACTYDPVASHICYVAPNQFDTRFFQSSPALTLAPGEFGSIVVAYVFAPPVALPGVAGGAATDVKPGDPRLTNTLSAVSGSGVNRIDSMTGYLGYAGDLNSNGEPDQGEFLVVPGSLLGKSLVAQNIFDNGFLLPAAPSSPDFFLVPGDSQVTVIWRPSATETTGDPYFTVVGEAFAQDDEGNPIPNLLYDPSYREFDVEGYRVYRGRVDNPSELTLIAQYDYSGTEILDFGGYINPEPTCYLAFGLACDFEEFGPGVPVNPDAAQHEPLVGNVIQVRPAGVALLADSTILVTAADTAVTGVASGEFPALEDTGVPFVYVDQNVRNGVRYFYSVTAFDVNSYISGDASLESARVTKSVTPRKNATNLASSYDAETVLLGRGQMLDWTQPLPTFDLTTQTFSGPMPPANAWEIGFIQAVGEVLEEGEGGFTARVDSIDLGSAWHSIPVTYYLTLTSSSAGTVPLQLSMIQDFTELSATANALFSGASVSSAAAPFGGSPDFKLGGELVMELPGNYWTNEWGRGWAFGPQNDDYPSIAAENGPRWFAGTNETLALPNAAYNAGVPTTLAGWNSNGELPNVIAIHEPHAYLMGYSGVQTRELAGVLGGAVRAADIRFYWGAGGVVDSVIDLTHNVPLTYDSTMGGGYGFLTAASAGGAAGSIDAQAGVVSYGDFWCVPPVPDLVASTWGCSAGAPAYKLQPSAALDPVVFGSTPTDVATAAAAVPGGQVGFGIYVAGHVFILAATALPAQGDEWTMRSYIGAVTGDDDTFEPNGFYGAPRTLSAIGVEVGVQYTVTNSVTPATEADIANVHTVPDPYYVTNALEQTTESKILQFVNLPSKALIRIYSSSGVLVDIIEHESASNSSVATWDLRNRNEQVVASGVYFFHVEANGEQKIGKFTVVNFAR